MSEDGYVAGPTQELENPLGVGGGQLHEWIFATRAGREMIGESGGTEDIENDVVRRGFQGIGATIMGRNMFGPVRGPWADSDWTGWWGESPPFHHDVFVLTHFERAPLALDDTTFHFVTDGIEEAIARAREAAGDRIIRLGGGAETIREFLDAHLVDSLYLAVVPVTLGSGARLLDGIGAWPEGYACASVTQGEGVTFYELVRS
jgi:dihydrofolate reductase